jgi:hypothetical protein
VAADVVPLLATKLVARPDLVAALLTVEHIGMGLAAAYPYSG